jgi:WD40 repeat protein
VAASADGKRIVTTSRGDDTARLWDATTGKELATLRAVNATRAVFTPDGRNVLVVGDESRLWPVDPLPTAIQRKPRELTPAERERFAIIP